MKRNLKDGVRLLALADGWLRYAATITPDVGYRRDMHDLVEQIRQYTGGHEAIRKLLGRRIPI